MGPALPRGVHPIEGAHVGSVRDAVVRHAVPQREAGRISGRDLPCPAMK